MLKPHIIPINKHTSPQTHFPIHDQSSEPDIDYETSMKDSMTARLLPDAVREWEWPACCVLVTLQRMYLTDFKAGECTPAGPSGFKSQRISHGFRIN